MQIQHIVRTVAIDTRNRNIKAMMPGREKGILVKRHCSCGNSTTIEYKGRTAIDCPKNTFDYHDLGVCWLIVYRTDYYYPDLDVIFCMRYIY